MHFVIIRRTCDTGELRLIHVSHTVKEAQGIVADLTSTLAIEPEKWYKRVFTGKIEYKIFQGQ